MTVFVLIAVAMATAAVVWVLPPLLRRHSAADGVARAASNLAVYRDQLAGLDADLHSGTLSAAQYEQAKLEIERRVLDEAGGERHHGARTANCAHEPAVASLPSSPTLLPGTRGRAPSPPPPLPKGEGSIEALMRTGVDGEGSVVLPSPLGRGTEGEGRFMGRTPVPRVSRNGRWTAAVLAATIPLGAASLYWLIGNPHALSPHRAGVAAGEHRVTAQQIEAMVAKLAARLEQNPDDAIGWAMLARSYTAMRRFPEAVAAFAKAAALTKDDADLLADYADALAVSAGRNIEGRPLELIKQALELDPNQWKALAMAGTAAFDRKDYKAAVSYWEKLLPRLPAESGFRESLTASIDEARQLGGIKSGAAPAPLP